MGHCKKCGTLNTDDAVYCENCGIKLQEESEPSIADFGLIDDTKLLNKQQKTRKTSVVLLGILFCAALIGAGVLYGKQTARQTTLTGAAAKTAENAAKEKEEEEVQKQEQAIGEQNMQEENKEEQDIQEQYQNPDKQEEKPAEEGDEFSDQVVLNRDYVLPESNARYMSEEDVSQLSLRALNYAKNEIYARHGRKFDSVELQNFFNSKSWYEGRYAAADFDVNISSSALSDVEKKNAELFSKIEFARESGGYKLDQ